MKENNFKRIDFSKAWINLSERYDELYFELINVLKNNSKISEVKLVCDKFNTLIDEFYWMLYNVRPLPPRDYMDRIKNLNDEGLSWMKLRLEEIRENEKIQV